MESKTDHKPGFFQKTVNTAWNLVCKYEQSRPTTKTGLALITLGLFSGVLGLVAGDPLAAGLCCNTISGLGALSLGASMLRNRARRRN